MPTVPKYNAVPMSINPTPRVDAFVVADIRVNKSGILIRPILASKINTEPVIIIIPLIISIISFSFVPGNTQKQQFPGMTKAPELRLRRTIFFKISSVQKLL